MRVGERSATLLIFITAAINIWVVSLILLSQIHHMGNSMDFQNLISFIYLAPVNQ